MNAKELREMRADRERNRRQRLEWVSWYADWVRRTPNAVWSAQQARMISSVLRVANEAAMQRRRGESIITGPKKQ